MRTRDGLRAAALVSGLVLALQAVAGLAGEWTGTGTHPASGSAARTGAAAASATPRATQRSGDGSVPAARRTRHVRAVLRDVHGARIGRIDITALPGGGNEVSVLARKLTPGFHGIHIHTVGACDPAGAKPFASAGGHFNPTGAAEDRQAGALPVLLASAGGRAQARFFDADFTIGELSGRTGASIVVHAGPDNYANVPTRYSAGGVAGPDTQTRMTGDSGARVACAVLFPDRTATARRAPTPAPTASPSPYGSWFGPSRWR